MFILPSVRINYSKTSIFFIYPLDFLHFLLQNIGKDVFLVYKPFLFERRRTQLDECSFEFLQKYLGRYMLQVHLWKEEENPLPRMDMGLRRSLGLKDAEPALGALYAQAKSHVLYRLYDMFQCRYLFLLLPGEERCLLSVGPYTAREITAHALQEDMERHHVPPRLYPRMRDCFAGIPLLQDDSFVQNALLAFGETVWPEKKAFHIEEMNSIIDSPLPDLSDTDAQEADQDEVWLMEKRYAYENELLNMVRGGHVHQLSLLQQFPSLAYDQRVPDPVRNIKNYAIISSTLFRKAAEEGGVHPLQINQYSTECAARIERIDSFEEGGKLMLEMIVGYAKLVRNQSTMGFSPPIRRCMAYIMANLGKELTLRTLAEQLNISPGYLSALFKKETGHTLTAYITEKRIALGASLLRKTNMQVQTVAQYCGIPDVNYFSRLFKRIKGTTPLQYRTDHKKG